MLLSWGSFVVCVSQSQLLGLVSLTTTPLQPETAHRGTVSVNIYIVQCRNNYILFRLSNKWESTDGDFPSHDSADKLRSAVVSWKTVET